jgi:hypothetical protein
VKAVPSWCVAAGARGFTNQNIGSRYLPTTFFRWLCIHYQPKIDHEVMSIFDS